MALITPYLSAVPIGNDFLLAHRLFGNTVLHTGPIRTAILHNSSILVLNHQHTLKAKQKTNFELAGHILQRIKRSLVM